MQLIVDANILFSFFRPESYTRELFEKLYLSGIKLIVPCFGLDEVFSLKEKICETFGINNTEFVLSFILLLEILSVESKSTYNKFLSEAKRLLGKHIKDAPYFALALSLNCAIWSNERRFKKQPEVKVFTTKELDEELSKIKP